MIIQEVLLIFIFGSLFGKIYETARIKILEKKPIEKGFLKGPYLPIYGFGAVLILLISYLNIPLAIKIILFGISTTTLELFAGKCLIKQKIKLWDYSKYKGNYKGLICFQGSLFWIILATIFYIFFFPSIKIITTTTFSKIQFKILISLFYIFLTFDFINRIKKK